MVVACGRATASVKLSERKSLGEKPVSLRKLTYLISVLACLPWGFAVGDESFVNATHILGATPAEAKEKPWSVSAELGGVITRGNSDTDSLNGKLRVGYEQASWRHLLNLEALGASDSGETTAERYLAVYKADYRFDERNYMFGVLRGERDLFSGFEYQISESVGYGRRIILTEKHQLDGEIGPGARQSERDDGETKNEMIARLAAAYRWKLSPTSEFAEDLVVLAGESNTETESVTGLKVKINSSLALRVSYTVKQNSDPPPGSVKTDTTTAINLVFDY